MAKKKISRSELSKKYAAAIRAAEAKYNAGGKKGSKAAASKAAVAAVDAKFTT